MGDDLPGLRRARTETVAGDGRPEASGRGMQVADQLGHAAGPDRSWHRQKPVPMAWLPVRVHGDVAVDEGQHFSVVLGSQHPGRARKPGRLQMAQVLVHRRRPRSHRPQQPITAPNDPASHAPARDRPLPCSGMLVTGHQASITRNADPLKDCPPESPLRQTIARAAVRHNHRGVVAKRDRSPWTTRACSRRSGRQAELRPDFLRGDRMGRSAWIASLADVQLCRDQRTRPRSVRRRVPGANDFSVLSSVEKTTFEPPSQAGVGSG